MIDHIQLEALREMEARERERLEARIMEGSPQSLKSRVFFIMIRLGNPSMRVCDLQCPHNFAYTLSHSGIPWLDNE